MAERHMLDPDSLETLWREVAAALAEVGRENESMYLAKLVLLLIGQRDDVDGVRRCIDAAKLNLKNTNTQETRHGQ